MGAASWSDEEAMSRRAAVPQRSVPDEATLIIGMNSPEAEAIHKALSSPRRAEVLSILSKQPMNVNEIATALKLTHSTTSVHVQILERAGLVSSEIISSERGNEKMCYAAYEKLVFEGVSGPGNADMTSEVTMPVGLFSDYRVTPPCGYAVDGGLLVSEDDAQAFAFAERANALLVWFTAGWVEYTLACTIPSNGELTRIELVCEMCSEACGHNDDWPSDITVWVSGVEIGTWTSPGDLGDRRGRLNPSWWTEGWTQYGLLKTWAVDDAGSYIDGEPAGKARLSDLGIRSRTPVRVRIGNKAGTANARGANIFGRRSGDYARDLTLRYFYREISQ